MIPFVAKSWTDANAIRDIPAHSYTAYIDPYTGSFVGIGTLHNDGFDNSPWSNVVVTFNFRPASGFFHSTSEDISITNPENGGNLNSSEYKGNTGSYAFTYNVPPFVSLPFAVTKEFTAKSPNNKAGSLDYVSAPPFSHLESFEKRNFTLYTTIPSDWKPGYADFYAESDQSVMYYPEYHPLVANYDVKGVSYETSQPTISGASNNTITFMTNITNTSGQDLDFDWVLQIINSPFNASQQEQSLKWNLGNGTTEHIEIIHSSLKALNGKQVIRYDWHPTHGGYYAHAIYIVSDIKRPYLLAPPFHYVPDVPLPLMPQYWFIYVPPSTTSIDGIECKPVEELVFHVHSHLDVFLNGQKYTVPAGIGISGNQCFYWLHTHTPDGVIHIELPREMNVTLGQFFDIWNSTESDPNLSNSLDSETVSAYVNGAKYNGDYRNVQLSSREEIALVIGQNPSSPIPATYPDYAPIA